MKRSLYFFLSLVLLLGPSLPVMAAEEPAKVEAAEPAKEAATPDLPEGSTDPVSEAPEDVTGTAEVETPKDELAKPGDAKPEVVESRFKMGNFLLGFLGGAALGGAAGVLFFSRGDNGFDSEKAKVMGPLVGLGGGLLFGGLSLLLGTTTPEAAKPPMVESMAPGQGSPVAQGISAKLSLAF